MRYLIGLPLLFILACGSSHAPGDRDASTGSDAGGADAGSCGPCDQPCCTRDPVTGATVAPFCPPPGLDCEGPPIMPCDCPPPPAGCTYEPGTCPCIPVCGPPSCADLGETECWARDSCAPMYDDDCCPTCRPIGACADCTDPVFFECLPREAACDPAATLCGHVPPESCGGPPRACAGATPMPELQSCTVPGCVPATEAACDDCPYECHPVTGGSCTTFCDAIEPRCAAGWVAEANGSCFTGYCIPASICEPGATTIGP